MPINGFSRASIRSTTRCRDDIALIDERGTDLASKVADLEDVLDGVDMEFLQELDGKVTMVERWAARIGQVCVCDSILSCCVAQSSARISVVGHANF